MHEIPNIVVRTPPTDCISTAVVETAVLNIVELNDIFDIT